MIVRIYSIKDVKADAFMAIWTSPTDGVAIRNFAQAVNQPDAKNVVNLYPEDHVLYFLGTFDDVTGVLEAPAAPKSLGVGTQYREVANG